MSKKKNTPTENVEQEQRLTLVVRRVSSHWHMRALITSHVRFVTPCMCEFLLPRTCELAMLANASSYHLACASPHGHSPLAGLKKGKKKSENARTQNFSQI